MDIAELSNAALNVIELESGVNARNSDIRSDDTKGIVASSAGMSGVLHNGFVRIYANVKPGDSGDFHLDFKIGVQTVTDGAFAILRSQLSAILHSPLSEAKVAHQAGLDAVPAPDPTSRMAAYASHLFGDLFYGGAVQTNKNTPFKAKMGSQEAAATLAVYDARVDELELHGEMTVKSPVGGTRTEVYVPIIAAEYDDGVTIPFVGYADEAIVKTDEGLEGFALDGLNWVLHQIFDDA